MTPQEQVDDWNRKYDSGIAVVLYGAGQRFLSVTQTAANIEHSESGKDYAVIRVHPMPFGWTGPVSIENISPVEPCDETDLDYSRAGGGATCEACGRTLRDHPMDLQHVGYDRRPFLHVLCDGRLVKL